VITATYTINQYTLEFVDHDGTVLQTADYDFGADLSGVTPPTDPTRVGYTFDGWSGTIPATMGATKVTIIASYSINEYTVQYNVDGVITDENVDFGSTLQNIPTPVKPGYEFVGWQLNDVAVDLSTYVQDTSNKTFVAIFRDVELPVISGVSDTEVQLSEIDLFTTPTPIVTDNVDANLVAIVSYFNSDSTIEYDTYLEFKEALINSGSGVMKYNVMDSEGNEAIEKVIVILVNDDVKPQVTGVENDRVYEKDTEVTITFNEGTASLNGEAIESGTVVNEAGDYVLIITDDAGNISTVSFTIEGGSLWWLILILGVSILATTGYIFKKNIFGRR